MKRTFEQIRKLILTDLSSGQKTINQVSASSRINWRTVMHHLNHLGSIGLVDEVLHSEYVRIFRLTEAGKKLLSDEVKEFIEIEKVEVKLERKMVRQVTIK